MPIYEFYCPDNNKLYSFLARGPGMGEKVPRCPDGDALPMVKQLSAFAVTGRHKGEGEEGGDEDGMDELFAGMDEAKMEAVFREMEGDLAGLDEEHPDPRALGQFMRKMADAMGGRVPGALEEMIGRLEKGEDPDALEEELGDALDDDDILAAFRKVSKARKAMPQRDPELYEMAEWV